LSINVIELVVLDVNCMLATRYYLLEAIFNNQQIVNRNGIKRRMKS